MMGGPERVSQPLVTCISLIREGMAEGAECYYVPYGLWVVQGESGHLHRAASLGYQENQHNLESRESKNSELIPKREMEVVEKAKS